MTAVRADYTPAERRLALAAVMIVLLLSALDQTIVSTAMPRIVAELRGLERIAWVGTAYLLTSTVMVPIYGKLGDMYGRRPILVFGVVVFLAASALCGLSGEFGTLPLIGDGMNQLIVCRAVQGIGGGALATGAFATVADLFPPAERGKYAGLFGGVFGLAAVLGPVVGGVLTDHATMTLFGHVISGWRFVFYVNLPLGAVALYVLMTRLPTGAHSGGGTIDWAGALLLLVTFVPLLLALSWGGHAHDWDSPLVLALLALSAGGLIALLIVERGRPEAIVPLDLFAEAVFARSNAALFLINMAFMGIVMFLPLYLQTVRGAVATESGFALLPLMGGLLFGSIVTGRLASVYKIYKPFLIGGGVILMFGMVLMLGVTAQTGPTDLALRMAIVGLGLGPGQGMFTLAIQNAVPVARVGVATSSAQFFRQIGSTIGVAIFGALLTASLVRELPVRAPDLARLPAAFDLSHAQALAMNPARIGAEQTAIGASDAAAARRIEAGLKESFAAAILGLFRVSAAIFAGALVMTLLVPGRRLRGREQAAATVADAVAAE